MDDLEKNNLILSRKEIISEIDALRSKQLDVINGPSLFISCDSMDKIRRYGINGYRKRYLHNPNRNITSNTKVFAYLKEINTAISQAIIDLEHSKIEIDIQLGPSVDGTSNRN